MAQRVRIPARIPNAPPRRRTKDKPHRGEVVAVGDGADTINVVPGDLILFAKYVGTDLRLDGEDYLILDTADLLAVIKAATAKSRLTEPAPANTCKPTSTGVTAHRRGG